MPSRGWRLIRFDMRLSVICLWPGLLSKLAGIIKREEVIFLKREEKASEQMKTEVGGQREERKIEADPVSCLLRRPLPHTNHQSANNTSRATILFTVERGSQLWKKKERKKKRSHYNLKILHLLLSASLCTWFKLLVFWARLFFFFFFFFFMPCLFCQPDQTRSSVVSFSTTKVCLQLILQCKHGRT